MFCIRLDKKKRKWEKRGENYGNTHFKLVFCSKPLFPPVAYSHLVHLGLFWMTTLPPSCFPHWLGKGSWFLRAKVSLLNYHIFFARSKRRTDKRELRKVGVKEEAWRRFFAPGRQRGLNCVCVSGTRLSLHTLSLHDQTINQISVIFQIVSGGKEMGTVMSYNPRLQRDEVNVT